VIKFYKQYVLCCLSLEYSFSCKSFSAKARVVYV